MPKIPNDANIKNVETAVSLKHFSNFWGTLNIKMN